jgi:hypothetical protein
MSADKNLYNRGHKGTQRESWKEIAGIADSGTQKAKAKLRETVTPHSEGGCAT